MRVLRGKTLKLGVSIAALMAASLAATTAAQAGAFAVREQSALYQGMSFAGSATGDELSSMFWNSAAAAAAPGMNTETHVSLVVPDTEIISTGTSILDGGLGLDTNSGDIGDPTPVAASYANYQVNERLFLGIATNAQYGFKTKPDNENFAGTPIATSSEIFSLNFNPTVAYKLTPELTIGVGAQILYADVRLRSSNTTGLIVVSDGREVEVDDIAFGATAGITWKPSPGTTIGVGYRSRIEVDAEGTCSGTGLSNVALGGCGAGTDVTAELTLPDLVTASFRQQVNERIAVLGTVEWTNWSLVGEQAEFKNGGNTVDVFPLGYDDGWFFALGLEYAYSPFTTLRGGIAYEISPISDEDRNVSLPDNDRVWLSFGATTRITEKISVDIAYTHIFVEDAPIEIANPGGGNLLVAESQSDVDIVSASFKYSFGGGEKELEPLK
ncbi:MAG: transporter [Rhodomicrobium sp.]|nr:transporter [Rhodomicrobium sp.]